MHNRKVQHRRPNDKDIQFSPWHAGDIHIEATAHIKSKQVPIVCILTAANLAIFLGESDIKMRIPSLLQAIPGSILELLLPLDPATAFPAQLLLRTVLRTKILHQNGYYLFYFSQWQVKYTLYSG